MKEHHTPFRAAEGTDQALAPTFERHYTVAELARLWNLGVDAGRRLFEGEPGVLVPADAVARHLKPQALKKYRSTLSQLVSFAE